MVDWSQYNLILPFNDGLAEQNRLGFALSLCTIELDKDIKADGHASEITDSILRSHVYERKCHTPVARANTVRTCDDDMPNVIRSRERERLGRER